jgi:AbrB family looped-hinge helix DNA binding protein
MTTAKVSSKGQLVLPKAVREAHGLTAGSEVEVEDGGDVIVLRPKAKRRAGKVYSIDEVAGFIKYEGPPVSIEDMNRAVSAEAKRRWDAERG